MKKHTITLLILVLITSFSLAQVTVTSLSNGTYAYSTPYSEDDLEFYLFGDGYHTFRHNPTHQYKDNGIPALPVLYHSFPYDDDEPEEEALGTITNGVSNPNNPAVLMENKIQLKRSWNLVHNRQNFFLLMFENTTTSTIASGCVEFHFQNDMSDVIENKILDDYNNGWVTSRVLQPSEYSNYDQKYKWNFANLQPDEQRFVYIPVRCLGDISEFVNTLAVMKEGNCSAPIEMNSKGDGNNDDVSDSNYYTLSSMVATTPHDPNCIVTETTCISPYLETQPVVYRIYFQNEGTSVAVNVRLDFFVTPGINAVKLVEASDNCILTWTPASAEMEMVDPSLITVNFNAMYLPGMNQPNPPLYEETIGWVDIEVCYNINSFQPLGTSCADSYVDIYFDNEPPVTANHSVCQDNACNPASNEQVGGHSFDLGPCDYTGGPIQYYPPNSNQENLQAIIEYDRQGADFEKMENEDFQNSRSSINVIPNPVADVARVEVPKSLLGGQLSIYDINGRTVFSQMIMNETSTVDLSQLMKGVYYISVVNETKVYTNTFVKL
ncbi:MAG: T9SS type A sorting domain-containing protein [Bacteroidota bacterium]